MPSRYAASMDGDSGTYFEDTTPNFGTPTSFTISCWVKLAATQSSKTFLSNFSSSGGFVPGISDGNANRLKFYLGGPTLESPTTLSNSTWYFCVFTYDGTTAKIYLDGSTTPDCSLTATQVYGGTPIIATYLGALQWQFGGGQKFNGAIAAIGLWWKALSTSEITSLYNSGRGSSYSDLSGTLLTGLRAYYDFADSSNLGLDSTATGANHTTNGPISQVDGPYTGPVGSNYSKSATTTIDVGSSGVGRNIVVRASATTGLKIGSVAAGRDATFHASATTGFELGVQAGAYHANFYVVAATTVEFGSHSSSHNPTVRASATTTIDVGSSAIGGVPIAPTVEVFGLWRLPMRLGQVGPGPIYLLAAETAVEFASAGNRTVGHTLTSAATTRVEFAASARPNPRWWRAAAATRLDVRAGEPGLTGLARAYYRASITTLEVGSAADEVRNAAVQATSTLEVGSAGVKSGVAYHVFAETSLGFGIGEKNNDYSSLDAATVAEFGVAATGLRGSTEAATTLLFSDLAVAEVWLPWRTSPLTLSPGGGLPH